MRYARIEISSNAPRYLATFSLRENCEFARYRDKRSLYHDRARHQPTRIHAHGREFFSRRTEFQFLQGIACNAILGECILWQ